MTPFAVFQQLSFLPKRGAAQLFLPLVSTTSTGTASRHLFGSSLLYSSSVDNLHEVRQGPTLETSKSETAGIVQVTRTSSSSSAPELASSSSSSTSSSAAMSATTTTAAINQESRDATVLVDDLLEYTQSLMDGYQHHVIAYSGGIDSSVVAALVYRCSKSRHGGILHNDTMTTTTNVKAVLGVSPAVPTEQIALAERVAKVIGIPLEQVPTTEGDDSMYIENAGQACLACKTHLYTALEAVVQHAGATTASPCSTTTTTTTTTTTNIMLRLYNGTNADDLNDPTRLGLIAADNFHVQSPLRYTTKKQVRVVGKHLGLPNWNYAASPCLRSRLAIGVVAIPEHLQQIETAERFVRSTLSSETKEGSEIFHNDNASTTSFHERYPPGPVVLTESHNLRVRRLANNRAMVEIDAELLPTILSSKSKNISNNATNTKNNSLLEKVWQPYFQNELGFESVQVRAFKSGSVASVPQTGTSTTTETAEVESTKVASAV